MNRLNKNVFSNTINMYVYIVDDVVNCVSRKNYIYYILSNEIIYELL